VPPRAVLASMMLALAFGLSASALAKHRLRRDFTTYDGLAASSVAALATDPQGFLWLGTAGGVVRFDGRSFERWRPEALNEVIGVITISSDGAILVAGSETGNVRRVQREGFSLVGGPQGGVLHGVSAMVFGGDDRLWACVGGEVLVRSTQGLWSRPGQLSVLGAESAQVLHAGDDHSVYVGTDQAVWRIDPAEGLTRIATASAAIVAIETMPDGTIFFAERTGAVRRVRDGELTTVVSVYARAISLARRGDTIWASWDAYLARVPPNADPEIISVGYGGPLLVDAEGSLWLGSPLGLSQFPEPNTVVFDTQDGLTKTHMRFLARSEHGVWATAWNEPLHVVRGDLMYSPDNALSDSSEVCVGQDGALWATSVDRFVVRRAENFEVVLHEAAGFGSGCSSAEDGTLWFGTYGGLFHVGDAPRHLGSLPGADSALVRYPHEDHEGRLWASSGELICNTNARRLRAGQPAEWQCERLEGIVHVTDMLALPSGAFWMATHAGIYSLQDNRWVFVDASAGIVGRIVYQMSIAPSGGLWLATHESALRIRPATQAHLPWTVLEHISAWNGLALAGATDVLEDEHGAVWLATRAGVARVPPQARSAQQVLRAPSIALTGVRVQGVPQSITAPIELPYANHHLELTFSSPTFRDPRLLRFQFRRHSGAWSAPSKNPVLTFVDLPPGAHRISVRASLDGQTWSALSAPFEFVVRRPWFLHPALWLGVLASLLGIGYAAHRARLTISLRLERQRLRIAMDLHDELGSGLGSIGLLASIADEGDVADKIANTAEELGEALTDIVWSLREGAGQFEQLAAHLRERGELLFMAHGATLDVDFPQAWPRAELSLSVRRNVQRIALEAMNNAAKHAQAKRVVLGVRCDRQPWCLWVQDDGLGFSPGSVRSTSRGGVGLHSMQLRANEIDAQLEITSGPQGTMLRLSFRPGIDPPPNRVMASLVKSAKDDRAQ